MLVPVKAAGETNGFEKKKPMQSPSSSFPLKPEYDPEFTDLVIAATGPKANPRLAQVMPSLLRHLHDFAREVDLTVAEWSAGVDLVSRKCSPPTYPSWILTNDVDQPSRPDVRQQTQRDAVAL